MKDNFLSKNNIKYLHTSFLFVLGLFIYYAGISRSGLWYDEAIEYFFSKFLSGNVPGSTDLTHNMYERIISTYQPPLYNVLMYVWLQFFDSEFSFRLAGILTTLIGMTGIYAAMSKVAGYKWAFAGSVIYILIPKVIYYALECGEYNLLLCCEAWTLYFFVKLLNQKDNISLAGFFIFSCLSVYSQYGAVFFVGGLYITLLLLYINDKNTLTRILTATLFSIVAVVLPLVYFFLIPQMTKQNSLHTSHYPVFLENNILYDFLISIIKNVKWVLLSNGTDSWTMKEIIFQSFMVIPFVFLSFSLFAALFKKNKKFLIFIFACLITYLMYYLCVATSFYAYHGYGNRYCLFLVPIWLYALIYALSIQVKTRGQKIVTLIMIMLIIVSGLHCVSSVRIKDDIRDVVKVWFDKKCFREKTLVHHWDEPTFQFYIRHEDSYEESFQENIITTGEWIYSAEHEDDIRTNLNAAGIFKYDSIFYVSPLKFIIDKYRIEIFMQVMKDAGYKIESLYEGMSVLLYMYR